MADVPVRKIPASDTRSRKDLMFGIIEAELGLPITRLCPCNTYSEKDLLYNILLAAQSGGSGLPPQAGHAGEFLSTDGTSAFWTTVPAATPGGAVNTLQFNSAGAFGGVSGWTTNGTTTITGGVGSIMALAAGSAAAPSLNFGSAGTGLFTGLAANHVGITVSGVQYFDFAADALSFKSTTTLSWGPGVIGTTPDLHIERNGIGILAIDSSGTPGILLNGLTGAITTLGLTISAVASTNCSITSTTGNSLTLATLDGNKNVIVDPHGSGSLLVVGSDNGVLIGRVSDATAYGLISFNGATAVATMAGLAGGATGDADIQIFVPAGRRVLTLEAAVAKVILCPTLHPSGDVDATVTLGKATNRWVQGFFGPTGLKIGDGTSGPTITASGSSPNEDLLLNTVGSGTLDITGVVTTAETVTVDRTVTIKVNGTAIKIPYINA